MTSPRPLSYHLAILAAHSSQLAKARSISTSVVEKTLVEGIERDIAAMRADHPTLDVEFRMSDHFAHDVGRGAYYKLPAVEAVLARTLAIVGALEKDERAALGSVASATTTVDSLTGLGDRKAMDAVAPSTLAECATAKRPCAVIMIDIDRFKSINDNHGHPKGDAVLRTVALRLTDVVHGKGRVFRYGGEEMLVLLPNHDSSEAASVSERMRKVLGSSPIEGITVTASFGVAVTPEHAQTFEQLVDLADKALYDAKNLGRDLVRLSGEPPPDPSAPRASVRKAPAEDGLSDADATSIRAAYFRTRVARCPRDEALLTVRESRVIGEPMAKLYVNCGLCGLSAVL